MIKKSIMAALATAAALALLPTAPAAAASIEIRPSQPVTLKQADSRFHCATNEVLIGREHRGDENGDTTFRCGQIWIDGVQATVLKLDIWGTKTKESSSNYVAPANSAISGIWHIGDENGDTIYYRALVFWQGKAVQITQQGWSSWMRESNHAWWGGTGEVMTGRQHSGDENGNTRYLPGIVSFSG
ncbi:hypothetical protein MF672_040005 [Actinomadura sp. ATCC 31491]|uniref:Secreted protein n=1 Tax=Actinomadura luzonensis TaxID=2805427 RepID=A0ABT0G5R8_9ACTN|nr:hypothetical protein [Actinomadura luzonensis]MCK2219939.1 hypothetical protein [Actinomadura luzonensis]